MKKKLRKNQKQKMLNQSNLLYRQKKNKNQLHLIQNKSQFPPKTKLKILNQLKLVKLNQKRCGFLYQIAMVDIAEFQQ